MSDRTAIPASLPVKHLPHRGRFTPQLAKWMRWLHIYLSMVSFAVVLFFSVTGITLNHPNWYETSEYVRESRGTLHTPWMSAEREARTDSSTDIQRLELVEYLRAHERVRGALDKLTVNDQQVLVTFRGPAYSADVFIDRTTGNYEVTERALGFVSFVNDLHKGRDTGSAFTWAIDLSALMLIGVSLTGFTLIFFIKRHRTAGLLASLLGSLLTLAIYVMTVPR